MSSIGLNLQPFTDNRDVSIDMFSAGWEKNQSINYFTRIFDSYLDVTIAGEGAANLGLYSALRVFEHGRIFIVPHML